MSVDLILMPRLGETMEAGTVRAWLAEPGQPFRRGDVIAEIETDKTTVEMPALADGTIGEILAPVGAVVPVGKPLARLSGGMGGIAGTPVLSSDHESSELALVKAAAADLDMPLKPPPANVVFGRVPASPAARRLAERLGVELADVTGSGPKGRRQGMDVRAYSESGRSVAGPADGLLHFVQRGNGPGLPVAFLHGFGGSLDTWTNIQNTLALHRPTIAFDLPGHGRSVAHRAAGFADMAVAVAATLDAANIDRAHLVGHSMGGGVGASLALTRPTRVASLTLFAPAGFGPEINRLLITDFARAEHEAEIAELIGEFFGPGARVPHHLPALLARTRGDPLHREALGRALSAVFHDGRQQVLDLSALVATGIPVRVIWGDHDRVLPFTTTDALPAVFALHRFRGAGHMPHTELPREAIRLIRETIRGE